MRPSANERRFGVSAAFEPDALSDAFAFVNKCPPEWIDRVVELPHGELQERIEGWGGWYQAVLAGTLPPEGTWPGSSVDGAVRTALKELKILSFCRNRQSLVDAVMVDVFEAFLRSSVEFDRAVLEQLKEIEALDKTKANARNRDVMRSPQELRLLAHARALDCTAMCLKSDAAMLAAWQPLVSVWCDIAAVFGDLGDLLGRGRDFSCGVLHHSGWRDLLRLHMLVKRLPQLRDLVRELGRLQGGSTEPSISETVFEPMRRIVEEQVQAPAPLVPADVRGVERGDSLSRMLPSQALLLVHPKLKLLWHARRAERALLTYRVEGAASESVEVDREEAVAHMLESPRPCRGPIIAVIDTSGSMSGTRESLAKALVLEALRLAHRERRRCLLIAFGGCHELAEMELSLDENGLGHLLEFLAMSFGAGTDPSSMVYRVLDRLRAAEWQRADVLVASDGAWTIDDALRAAVLDVRQHGVRFHGVQVGATGRSGLHSLCDHVHQLHQWMVLGESGDLA